MEFRTQVKIPSFDFSISYQHRLLMLGSCFTENIGKKLLDHKFNVKVNPFGILYNPMSIKQSLEYLILEKKFTEEDLFLYNGLFHSFSHHSRFSAENADNCLHNITDSLHDVTLKDLDILCITFGTSYVYQLKSTNQVVSNCHKLPDKLFHRKRLTVEEIVEEYSVLIDQLKKINRHLKILFSVSPIRHWKDGAHENQLSKSILHLAIDCLQTKYVNTVYYFPAYEIVLDELRDYRFYNDDMIHISDLAVEYIWECFCGAFFTKETKELLITWKKIKAALQHRPFHPLSEEYQLFLKKNEKLLYALQEQHPFFNIEEELKEIKNKVG